MSLTVNQVKNAKPGRRSDGNGLYLLVKPGGSRSWVLRVQYRGARRDFGLGSVDLGARSAGESEQIPLLKRKALTLAEAREKAALGRALAKAGINPSLEWKGGDEAEAVPTFEEAARRYHAEVQTAWRNGKHGDQWLNTLQSYAFPVLGKKLVSEIEAPAVRDALVPIWLTIPETARRVRQRILAVLDNAKGQGWREHEAPVRALAQLLKGIKQPKGKNFPALPYPKIPELVARVRAEQPSVGRAALLFCLLTASRPGNVRSATWEQIDIDARLWTIPGAMMKTGEPHTVPLTDAAVAILEEMRGLVTGRKGEPVFPGNRGKPLSDATIAKAFRLAGGAGFTVHGTARSGFRDWVAEQTSFPGDWAEAALAHALKDKTEAAYKRTRFLDQRRDKLMPAWATFIMGEASNVVSLMAAAK